MNCLFCGIVNGEVTASIVLEDEVSIAFLDHHPISHIVERYLVLFAFAISMRQGELTLKFSLTDY